MERTHGRRRGRGGRRGGGRRRAPHLSPRGRNEMVMVMVAPLSHTTAREAFEDSVGSVRCSHGGVTGSA